MVRKKGIGVPMGAKRIKQMSEVENHEELIAFFNKMGTESVRKQSEGGLEREGGKKWAEALNVRPRIKDSI